MRIFRWATDSRYYQAALLQDLLGDFVVYKTWGGIGQANGGSETIVVQSTEHGLAVIAEIEKRRLRRGYVSVKWD